MMTSYHKRTSEIQYRTRGYRTVVGLFLSGIALGLFFSGASCAAAVGLDTTKDNWAMVGGYGQSFPGWGQTTQRVETVDLIPRYNHRIFDKIGSGWYSGYHSILLELPVSIIVSPDVSSMVALIF